MKLRKLFGILIRFSDLIRFQIRKMAFGFDQANIFLRQIGKDIIIPFLKRYGAEIGKNCDIEVPLIFHNCIDYRNLKIGNNVHIGKDCFFDLRDKISIKDNVVISMQVSFITHIDMSKSNLNKVYYPEQMPILIMEDSYIGANATILMGVTIGEFSIVAAGSVVRSDVQPWTVVAGVPAKKLKDIPRF